MKRIGYCIGVVSIAFALTTSYTVKTVFASSCCGTKEASAAEKSENKCVVCGKAVEKDKGVNVEHEGKTVTLCCKSCAASFKDNPEKFCKGEKCEKQGEHHEEHHHGESHH